MGWGPIVNLDWGKKEQGNKHRARVGLAFGDWLTEQSAFLVKGVFAGTQKLSKFLCADIARQATVTPSWAQKVISTEVTQMPRRRTCQAKGKERNP